MACLPKVGLAVVVLLALAAPAADATTIVDSVGGAGPEAGSAIGVTGDRRANDITITPARIRSNGRVGAAFKIADRRSRVRSRLPGCHAHRRHTVTCPFPGTSFFYVHLGAGSDRLTVKGFKSVPEAVVSAPDGLAAFPQDEGSGGSFLGWIIDGGAGDDLIVGSPYFDHIIGGPGSDVLYGRAGDDLFEERGEPGEDRIFGGSGHDALRWDASTPLSIDLRQGTFNGGSVQSIDKVRGGAGEDVLIGSDRPEMLQGAAGADAIAGLGGSDLLIGDGLFTLNPGSDRIDGGPGDDLIDISNRAFQPYGSGVDRSSQGPADVIGCADGNDRVDTFDTQLVPVDCEGARFDDAATTVPLRPVTRPDGALVFDVPCPAQSFYPRPIGTCDGTLTLTDPADRRVLGSAAFSARGGARAVVTVKPAPSPAGRPIAVRITGAFDHANASDSTNQFDFGWATTF